MRYKPSQYLQIFEGSSTDQVVAINSYTGGSYSFRKDVFEKIRTIVSLETDLDEGAANPLTEFLISEQIIIPYHRNEFEELKQRHRSEKASTDELYITYTLTNACNFRCTYCYQEHGKSIQTPNSISKSLNFVQKNIDKYNGLKVHWFGGEPLLQLKNLLSTSGELRKICDRNGKRYFAGITTNGALFNADAAALLRDQDVRQIQFTLDGARDMHDVTRLRKDGRGSYDKVISAIKTAVDFRFIVFVRVNLSAQNSASIGALCEDLGRHGLSSANINLYINEMKDHGIGTANSNIYFSSVAEYGDTLIDALKTISKYGYPIPRLSPTGVNCAFDRPSSVLFGVDGNLYHCTTGTDRALATLSDDGEIAQETDRRRQIHQREPWDDPDCAKCKNLPTCMGGCAYLAEEGKTKCNPEGFVLEKLLRLSLKEGANGQ